MSDTRTNYGKQQIVTGGKLPSTANNVLHGNPQIKGTGAPGIRNIYKPDDKQVEALRFVYYDRYQAMKNSGDRKEAEKNWDRWEKQWENFRIPRNIASQEEWQSNHVVPLTISVVETALSEMSRQNLAPIILPQGDEDIPHATIMGHIWDYTWDISDSDLAMYDIEKDLLTYGTAIAQEYYLKDKRMVRDIGVGEDGKPSTKESEVYDYDDCILEPVKLQDFYVDEYARGFTGPYRARDCIRRYIMDIDAFHLMYDDSQWDQFKNAKLVKPGGDLEYYEFYKPPQGIDDTKQVEVLHYWSIIPKDRFIILANDVIVYDGPNPYKHKQLPFVRAVDVKRPHRFYGKGEPELLESIQDESNTLRRMIIDRNHLDIDKMFFVSNRLGLNDEDLMARPHGMIPTDDVNGAKAIEYGDIPRSVEMSLDHLEDDATISTGINPRAQALPQAGTATEAAILKESTLRRIGMKLWMIRKETLKRIGRLRTSNILQFYSQPRLEEIVGEKGTEDYKAQVSKLENEGLLYTDDGTDYQKTYRKIPIKNKQLGFDVKGQLTSQRTNGFSFFELKPDYFMPVNRGGYVLKFDSGANIDISKPLKQQQDLDLFDRGMQVMQLFPGSYDPVKFFDMILRDDDKNPDDLKPDPTPQDQDLQRTQMLIDLANVENQQMMKGIAVPATPFASTAHTLLHVKFMESPPFQQTKDPTIDQNFTHHVVGEIMAQEARNQSGAVPLAQAQAPGQGAPGQPQGQPPPAPQGGGANGIGNGMLNRPGGMSTTGAKLQNVLPAYNSGGGNPHV